MANSTKAKPARTPRRRTLIGVNRVWHRPVPLPERLVDERRISKCADRHADATGRLLRFRGECSPPQRALAAVWRATGWSLCLGAICNFHPSGVRHGDADSSGVHRGVHGLVVVFFSFASPSPQSSHSRRSRRLSAGTTMKNVTEEVICSDEV